jgi:flagellar assembly protein FliH
MVAKRSSPFKKVINPAPHELFGSIPEIKDQESRTSDRLNDQIELLRQQGYQEGYERGFDNGKLLGNVAGKKQAYDEATILAAEARAKDAEELAQEWAALRSEFEITVQNWFRESEHQMTNLAMEVVRKILASELEINRQTALSITKDVLSKITNVESIRIRVNPGDSALLASHRQEILNSMQSIRSLEFTEDPSIEFGVQIETESGVIDSTVETRLDLTVQEFEAA